MYGEEIIHYAVVRKSNVSRSDNGGVTGKPSPSASRKITIKVHTDQRVVVTAPVDATSEAIQTAMLKQARWIWQSIQEFASQQDHVLPKTYVSGETQFYLGRRYVLKVFTEPNAIASVKLLRGKLQVTLRHEHARQLFHER